MFLITEQYAASSKAFLESRLAAFSALTSIALQGAEKIVALNIAIAKASADNSTATAKDLLAAKDPQAAFSLVTACAKPNADKVASYSRDLTEILSATKVELTKIADAQVAETQSKVRAWVDDITKNAPAGTEPAGAMLKSVVATAQAGYEQINSVAKQAAEVAETHAVNAPDEFAPVARKSAAR